MGPCASVRAAGQLIAVLQLRRGENWEVGEEMLQEVSCSVPTGCLVTGLLGGTDCLNQAKGANIHHARTSNQQSCWSTKQVSCTTSTKAGRHAVGQASQQAANSLP